MKNKHKRDFFPYYYFFLFFFFKGIGIVFDPVHTHDDDVRYSCAVCRVILHNIRRSCSQCPNSYDICDTCFRSIKHEHPLVKQRKMEIEALIQLVQNAQTTLNAYDEQLPVLLPPPPLGQPIHHALYHPTVSFAAPPTKSIMSGFSATSSILPEPVGKSSLGMQLPSVQSNSAGPTRKRTRSRENPTTIHSITQDDDYEDSDDGVPPPKNMPGQYQQDNYGDDEVINCVCGNNKDLGFMISCERCRAWLHAKCVGISKKNEPDEYYCPNCVKKTGLSSSAKLKRSIDKIQL